MLENFIDIYCKQKSDREDYSVRPPLPERCFYVRWSLLSVATYPKALQRSEIYMSNATQIDVQAYFIDVNKVIHAGRNASLHIRHTSRRAREEAPGPTRIKAKSGLHPCNPLTLPQKKIIHYSKLYEQSTGVATPSNILFQSSYHRWAAHIRKMPWLPPACTW